MNLRPYERRDLDAVVAIFRSNIPKYFGPEEEQGLHEFLAAERADNYYVIEIDGEVVGAGGIAFNDIEKFGFQLVEHKPNGFGPGIDNCRMRLDSER
jgi:hypothetical protein